MKNQNLTFDNLSNLLEENYFANQNDKKIVEIILDAERDWRKPIETLNEFIVILENELNGQTTKSNLKMLLDNYNGNLSQYGWESESISSLLSIFQLTEKTDLNAVFDELIERTLKNEH